jgi:hypothetical protein
MKKQSTQLRGIARPGHITNTGEREKMSKNNE